MKHHKDDTILPFYKDAYVEHVLADMNEALYPVELQLVKKFRKPSKPVIFILGLPRSGTTLLMQLMINAFQIGYISNLIARFWKAPYIGTLLARDIQRRQIPSPPLFISELGATYGYDGPHEFGFFWQRWFPYGETHQPSEKDLQNVDFELLLREIAAIESVFDAPLVFKNPIVFSLNMDVLAKVFPTALFIICQRNRLYIAQSLLLSRLKYHGRKDAWFSVKPKEFVQLKERPYPEQLAGQIYYTEKRIQESLAKISVDRYIIVNYTDMCKNPLHELERIQEFVGKKCKHLVRTEFTPEPFRPMDIQRLEDEEFRQLKEALKLFYDNE